MSLNFSSPSRSRHTAADLDETNSRSQATPLSAATASVNSCTCAAEINSPARPFNPEELKKLQEQLQAFYDQFVEKAADSRHSTPEQIDALAQGRVWTGRQAKQNHLVDELGGLDRAIAIAKQRAKIPSENDVELVIYPPRKSFYELVSDQFSGSSESATVGAWLNANLSRGELEVLRTMRGPLALFRRGEPLALMPFTFVR